MPAALQFLVLTFAGWVNRHQDDLIEYLREENRVLRGCFRHQVLLRRDRHVHDGGSGRPTQVSEHPHVAQPPDNAP